MRIGALAFAATASLTLAACASGDGAVPTPAPSVTTATPSVPPETPLPPGTSTPPPISEVQHALDDARATWQAKGINSYRFIFRWHCFCPPPLTEPVVVTVSGGAISGVVLVDGGTPLTAAQIRSYRTIDGLLDFVQEAIDRQAVSIMATFDATYGYPSAVSVDYIKMAVDEEQAFVLERFEPLGP